VEIASYANEYAFIYDGKQNIQRLANSQKFMN
jgi:hypothetical protein